MLDKNDKYVQRFLREASPEQAEFLELACKILGHCSMGCIFDFTDDFHLDSITSALIEVQDEEFYESLRKVTSDEEYLKIKIPSKANNDLIYYIKDGQENILSSSRQ